PGKREHRLPSRHSFAPLVLREGRFMVSTRGLSVFIVTTISFWACSSGSLAQDPESVRRERQLRRNQQQQAPADQRESTGPKTADAVANPAEARRGAPATSGQQRTGNA